VALLPISWEKGSEVFTAEPPFDKLTALSKVEGQSTLSLLFLFSFEGKENKNHKSYDNITILFEYMLLITLRWFFISPKRGSFSFLPSSAQWNACPLVPCNGRRAEPIPPGSTAKEKYSHSASFASLANLPKADKAGGEIHTSNNAPTRIAKLRPSRLAGRFKRLLNKLQDRYSPPG